MSQLVGTPVGTWSLIDLTTDEVAMIGASLEESAHVIDAGSPDMRDPYLRDLVVGLLTTLETWRKYRG